MLTTATLLSPLLAFMPMSHHPGYVFLAIGFGSMFGSWMNDGAFWIGGRFGGLTVWETLKSWTVQSCVASLAGLVQTMILTKLLPLN
jgi:gluconate:H+ symporter, GntP family